MHFSSLASTLLALTAFTSASPHLSVRVDPNPYNTSAGALATNYPGGLDFYSNCWSQKGCKWEQAIDDKGNPIKGANQCSCNNNPDKWADIIWFYSKAAYTGDLYKGFGHYGECQDLPTRWNARTQSCQLAPSPAAICKIYTQPGCDGSAGVYTTRDSSKASENQIREFVGLYKNGVRSWKCDRKAS